MQKSSSPSTLRARRLTGSGRSAVAVIRVTGPTSSEAVLRGCRLATERSLRPGQVRYGVWHGGESADESPGESIVITPLERETIELHCHGGPAAIERILEDLRRFGAQVFEAAQAEDESVEPLVSESLRALSRCVTERTAAVAMDQVRGAMRSWANGILAGELSDLAVIQRQAGEILSRSKFGASLGRPLEVVVIGRPNVGKSSLVNAITGYQRSIVFDASGTTRDVLQADTVIRGIPIRLSDTAGIRNLDSPGEAQVDIEREGISRARGAADSADLALWVIDLAEDSVTQAETASTDSMREIASLRCPVITVGNKVDLSKRGSHPAVTLTTVATRAEGIEPLMDAIVQALVAPFPQPGQAVPTCERQIDVLEQLVAVETVQQATALARQLIDG